MRKTAYLLGTLFLLTGCFHQLHELRPSSAPVGYLATSLRWELPEDAGQAIRSLSLSPLGAGAAFTRNYAGPRESSSELLQVPVGTYELLSTVNMTPEDGFILSGLPATKAFAGGVSVSVRDPLSSPPQAWFGVAPASVQPDAITAVELPLQRLLSTLSVSIVHVPAGATLSLTLSNVASSVTLTEKDGAGRYGLPGAESVGDLLLATLGAPASGSLGIDGFTVFPTASAHGRCTLTVSIVSAAGIPLVCVCDAPVMEAGKAYTLALDYNTLQPYMYLDSFTIGAWEEGWTVSGEILDSQI